MILHTVSASPDSTAFRDCLSVASSEDAVLLLGDGVYALLPGNSRLDQLLGSGVQLNVLRADALAAGVTRFDERVSAIDMAGFVALTERYPRQMAWF